jgi:hypothetical protein
VDTTITAISLIETKNGLGNVAVILSRAILSFRRQRKRLREILNIPITQRLPLDTQ